MALPWIGVALWVCFERDRSVEDRKSTRLNSSHQIISYAVFCLKKKTAGAPSLRIPSRNRRTLSWQTKAAACPGRTTSQNSDADCTPPLYIARDDPFARCNPPYV